MFNHFPRLYFKKTPNGTWIPNGILLIKFYRFGQFPRQPIINYLLFNHETTKNWPRDSDLIKSSSAAYFSSRPSSPIDVSIYPPPTKFMPENFLRTVPKSILASASISRRQNSFPKYSSIGGSQLHVARIQLPNIPGRGSGISLSRYVILS